MNPRPSVTTSSSDGSVLIEAVVGIGLLAVLAASIAGLVPVTLDAAARAEARAELLVAAEQLLEATLVDVDARPEVVASQVPCEHSLALASRHRTVALEPPGPRGGGPIRLTGLAGPARSSAVEPTGPDRLVRLRLASASAITGTIVADGPGGRRTAVPRPGGACVDLEGLEPGRHRIGASLAPGDGPGLIDPTHVTLADRTRSVTVAGGDLDVVLDAALPAVLRVTAESDGARTADLLSAGPLRWSVRGDDANVAIALGEARAVHPGDVTVVVSACPDPEAQASARRVQLAPGEDADVVVPLAVVTVEGVATHPDARLLLVRLAACADGTDVRPALRWDGGLHEGMRIALPRGAWEASLWSASGPITGTVIVPVGESDAVVRIP